MKRIIKNYIVRDPNRLLKNISRKYDFIKFKPLVDKQTIFDNTTELDIGEVDSTELFINGVKYTFGDCYTLNERKQLVWLKKLSLSPSDEIVFVYR